MRFVFWLSIAANLLLLTSIVAARVDSRREQAWSFESPAESRQAGNQTDNLIRSLSDSGLADDDVKVLVMGWLEAGFRNSYPDGAAAFWQPEYRPGVAALKMELAVGQKLRDALIALYGADSIDDPAFVSAFRPLGQDYAFLTSKSQINLQEFQLGSLQTVDLHPARQAGELARCVSAAMTSQRRSLPGPAAGLDPATEREYLLRFSPLANELRRSRVANDEQTFRSLFARLLELERDPTPAGQARLRETLRSTVGDAAFNRLWSGRDPFYSRMEQFLAREGFTSEQIQQAYAVINESQQRLLVAMGTNANPQALMGEVNRIRQKEAADLASMLGDEATAGLANAIRQAAVTLSRASTTDC